VDRSFADVQNLLRLNPDKVLRLAYGQSEGQYKSVIRLAPFRKLPLIRVPVSIETRTLAGPPASAISICWKATHAKRAFPVMRAELGGQPVDGQVELVLKGTYAPPLGLVGLISDRLVGRWFARATVTDFLTRLVNEFASWRPGE
jgi:hypothetical protein